MVEKELEKNLEFIKKTMEESRRYTNIPAVGYVVAGILGLVASVATFRWLGVGKLEQIRMLTDRDVEFLAVLWAGTFAVSVGAVMFFTRREARRRNVSAWNALTARLFLSQIPTVAVAGVMTLALVRVAAYELIPSVWLLTYAVILCAFSYFTGPEQKIGAFIFMLLGTLAAFLSPGVSLLMLAAGFGGVHIVFGMIRILKPIGTDGTAETE